MHKNAKLLTMCADSRFAKPQNSLQGDGFILFASAKRTKKHAQRAFSVGGGAPTPREMPRSGKNLIWIVLQLRYADLRFAKPHKFLKRNVFSFFSLLRKEPKVAQRVAALSTPGDGSKLYRLCFFVLLPSFVPKLVCGATHFFGCFEPVRKGYCSADARPIFFENGLLYYKLTGASRIRKGRLHVIFAAVGLCI